ncbi:MAG: hypothetical protein Q8K45_08680 [Rubrivivax sp.]|nr:hypothetical protein [Rubrivivax sp.]
MTKLLADLHASNDAEAKGVLRAELGCYLARVGEFGESERIRQELRSEFGDARSFRVSILIMMMEALQLYYRNLSPSARDRMLRASLLSKGFRDKRLIARTSAWMAHIELNAARFDAMASELETCLSAMEPGDDITECRAALVFGDAFLIAGLSSQSQAWYERARQAATRLGDHAAVGAMTYNRAALRVARCRYERLTAESTSVDVPLLRLDVESAINYQSVARLRSLEHLLTTAKVGLLFVQGDYVAAIPYIQELLASGEVAPASAQRSLLMADYAFALAKASKVDEAIIQLESASKTLVDSIPTDDLCLILSSLRDAAGLCFREEACLELGAQLREANAKHENVIAELRKRLGTFDPPLADRPRLRPN